MGIEPTSSAWKAEVLPLNYTRESFIRLTKAALPHTRSTPPCVNGGGGWIRTTEGGAVRFTV